MTRRKRKQSAAQPSATARGEGRAKKTSASVRQNDASESEDGTDLSPSNAHSSLDNEFTIAPYRKSNTLNIIRYPAAYGPHPERLFKSQPSWKTVPWIRLQDAGGPDRTVIKMSWDHQGVLLAVLYSNFELSLFEWDTVVSTYIKGQTHQLRNKTKKLYTVPPIWSIQVQSGRYSSMQWNPHDPNELVLLPW
jgi:hypothetical protein